MQLSIFNTTFPTSNITTLNANDYRFSSMDGTRPFLRYPGSKFRAAKYIEPFWTSVSFDEYREPFLGCGAIFFRMPKAKISWLNDVDKDLIDTFNVVSTPTLRKKLLEMVYGINPTKELFEKLKTWKPQGIIERAYRYFFINRTSYSGIMNMPNWGFHPIKSVQADKWVDRIIEAGLKLESKVKITNLSYSEVITKESNERVWLFLDPPYFKADQKRAYSNSFTYSDHLQLEKLLRKTNHLFCLTYDNCDEIKELYSWAYIHEVEWRYHTANSNVTSRKMGRELIIANYQIA